MEEIRREVVRYVANMDYVSFVELERLAKKSMNVDGSMAIEILPNVLIWLKTSQEFVDLIMGLVKDGMLEMKPSSLMVYMCDGKVFQLPIAKSVPKNGYKKEHWLPVTFRATKAGREWINSKSVAAKAS